MEFLNFLLIAATVYLVLRMPDKEQLAFGLLVTSVVLMAFLFLLGTRTSLLPPFNY
jgi:multisubunit Na+/H+ antiporter MnhC subunit